MGILLAESTTFPLIPILRGAALSPIGLLLDPLPNGGAVWALSGIAITDESNINNKTFLMTAI
jgi:hypothetical protein